MADAINAAILSAVEEGPLPIGFVHQTLIPAADRDLLLKGGSFLRSGWPAVQSQFVSPTPGKNFEKMPRSAILGGGASNPQKYYRANSITVVITGTNSATLSLRKLVGEVWSGVTIPAARVVSDVHFGNGVWLVLTTSGDIYRSTDNLATFTTVTAPSVDGAYFPMAALYDAGKWLIVLAYGSGRQALGQTYYGELHCVSSTDDALTFSSRRLIINDGSHLADGWGSALLGAHRVNFVKSGGRYYLIYSAQAISSGGGFYNNSNYIRTWPLGTSLSELSSTNIISISPTRTVTAQVIVDANEDIHLMSNMGGSNQLFRDVIKAGSVASPVVTGSVSGLSPNGVQSSLAAETMSVEVNGTFMHARLSTRFVGFETGSSGIPAANLTSDANDIVTGVYLGDDGFVVSTSAASTLLNWMIDRYGVHYAPYFVAGNLPNASNLPFYMRAR